MLRSGATCLMAVGLARGTNEVDRDAHMLWFGPLGVNIVIYYAAIAHHVLY